MLVIAIIDVAEWIESEIHKVRYLHAKFKISFLEACYKKSLKFLESEQSVALSHSAVSSIW